MSYSLDSNGSNKNSAAASALEGPETFPEIQSTAPASSSEPSPSAAQAEPAKTAPAKASPPQAQPSAAAAPAETEACSKPPVVKDVAHTEYQSVRSREVIFPCEEESRRRFYLRFADERHTWCDLPLAEMGTVKRSDVEAQTAEAGQNKQNIMIPIVPLRYTTPDRDPKQADLLRQNGYIYIFWGEEGSDQLTLWREVQVLESGKFKDINLQYYAGQDARPATARDVDNRLLLPYRLDGRNMQLAIAFADVQWSWAQINAFGGMAEDDFRIADFRGPRPPAMPTQEELGNAAELRDQRLQWVKLHGFADGFPYQAAQGQDAAVDNIANAPDLYALLPERQSNLPVVYLDDPLGIAYRLAGEYQGRWHEMRSTLAELAKQPHFQSATIVTQSLYRHPPEPPVEYRETPRGKKADPGDAQAHRSWSEMQKAKQKLRGNIDRAELERVLGVARRREIRERIAESKQALVDYLGEQHREGAVTLHAASDDYVRLPAEKAGAKNANPHYGCLWDCWEKLIAQLADTPHTLDLALELDQPSDEALTQETEQDPGRRFLVELMSEEQKHEIQRRLLPNENDNEYFRDDAFVASLAISRNTVKFVSGFLSHYTEGLIQKIIQSEKNKIFTLLHRGNLELEDLNRPTVDFYNTKTRKLVKPEGYIFLTQVVDANLTRSGADDIPQNQRSLPLGDGHRARLSYQDEASGAVMAATGGRALQGRLTLGWERLLGELQKSHKQTRINLIVFKKPAATLDRFLVKNQGAIRAFFPLLLALEGWNISQAAKAYQGSDRSNTEKARVLSSLLDMGAAVADIRRWHLQRSVDNQVLLRGKASEVSKVSAAKALKWAGRLGVGGGAVSALISINDAINNWIQGDDAWIAHATLASGSAAGALGAFGLWKGAQGSVLLAVGMPAVVAGFVLVGIGLVLIYWVFQEDTPLEVWCRFGPFGQERNNLPSQEIDAGTHTKANASGFHRNPAYALEYLLGHLYSPALQLQNAHTSAVGSGRNVGKRGNLLRVTMAIPFATPLEAKGGESGGASPSNWDAEVVLSYQSSLGEHLVRLGPADFRYDEDDIMPRYYLEYDLDELVGEANKVKVTARLRSWLSEGGSVQLPARSYDDFTKKSRKWLEVSDTFSLRPLGQERP